ncbi:dihydrolipoyl dehydrogenase family protein [Parasphingopyxis marina]|uniref:FAD-dependent oxidoreductase n=1 Tax=Parasphingopyxis marina TaxID=2761622 RepID=A0A842HSM9_9SPHN|nr:FAD-dependent oxidoreductase [Parasphingopyxis marina]MBC2776848.1 FAD-dependent oxidoreductase [Parasphingopyxis marina]
MQRTHDLIVIGAGSAGLTAAGGCGQFGLKVALVEKGPMGGDCLNTGCVPSKALITAARRAQEMRENAKYGIADTEPKIDFHAVHAHVQRAIASIAVDDSQERFEEEFGVEVIRGEAKIIDGSTIEVNGRTLKAPRICLAIGSKPFVPPVGGLADIPYLTNETIFDLTERPEHLLVMGGGPIGMEMAQSFRRLGSRVTVIQRGKAMDKDDPEAAAIVVGRFQAEGVDIREDTEVKAVSKTDSGIAVETDGGDTILASHVLVATGRTCDFAGFGLENAGIEWSPRGITVDAKRRTTNKKVYAIGDCRVGPRFTHASGYEGSLVVLQVALGLGGKADYTALPWVTYSDPELAQVGMTEAQAREKFGEKAEVTRRDFSHNDRARAENDTGGFLKIIRKGKTILGATIVGPHAGELLLPWSLAIGGKANAFAIGGAIVPYPTRSDISKQAGYGVWEPTIFGSWPKRWARFRAKYLL